MLAKCKSILGPVNFKKHCFSEAWATAANGAEIKKISFYNIFNFNFHIVHGSMNNMKSKELAHIISFQNGPESLFFD